MAGLKAPPWDGAAPGQCPTASCGSSPRDPLPWSCSSSPATAAEPQREAQCLHHGKKTPDPPALHFVGATQLSVTLPCTPSPGVLQPPTLAAFWAAPQGIPCSPPQPCSAHTSPRQRGFMAALGPGLQPSSWGTSGKRPCKIPCASNSTAGAALCSARSALGKHLQAGSAAGLP